MNLREWLFGPSQDKRTKELPPADLKKKAVIIPTARSSEPPMGNTPDGFSHLTGDKQLVKPGYQFDVVPLLRQLALSNQNISQALSNYVNLSNTGHKVIFDSSVDDKQVDKMREHLDDVIDTWHYGSAGMHGLINKFIAQSLISGAVAGEVVPKLGRDGVHRVAMILPETIRFLYNKTTETYEPYQKIKNPTVNDVEGLRPLNVNTFKYYAINGDTELPYGNPIYAPALGPLNTQKKMLENIDFIISQMGIMGFMELLIDKPLQADGEADSTYAGRLDSFLTQCKNNMKQSMRDGLMVGYQEDHEFKFHSASTSAQGVAELFEQNEKLVFSGMKQDPTLSGRSTGGNEAITIIFTKLIAELTNIQLSVGKMIEHAYTMELRLAGFQFRKLTVKFNASTIQDDLKMQQAAEIKIRNNRQLRMDGIISQDQYADNMNIDKPHQQEPVVPFAPVKSTGDPNLDAQKKSVREKSKDVSDKRVRAKNRPQG